MKLKKIGFFGIGFSLLGLIIAVFYLNNRLLELEKSQKESFKVQTTEFKRVNSQLSDKVTNTISPSSFREVSAKITSSVVYIESEVEMSSKMPKDKNHQFNDFFNSRPNSISLGSGVLISDDGFILTNNHVIEGAIDQKVTVVLNDNRIFDGKVLGTDSSTDLAVVKIEGSSLTGIELGDSDEVQVGDWVLAVGNPFRLRSTVTAGIVSALSRDVSIIDDRMKIENFIQTDAAINKGNSGGALVNQFGELIGINTAIATETGSYEGYGFAIPINMASKIARDIIEFGQVQRAYLGAQIISLSARRARQLGLDNVSGVEIVGTIESGAAAIGGVKVGDIVLAINDKQVSAYNELQAKIAEFRPGDEIDLSVWDNGKIEIKKVILKGADNQELKSWIGEAEVQGNQSENFEELPKLIQVEKLTSQIHIKVEISPIQTILSIDSMDINSSFAKSGLKIGDIILEINSKPIQSFTDLKIHYFHYISKKENLTFKIERDGKVGFYTFQSKK